MKQEPVPQQPAQTHRIVLVVEVDEPTELSRADLVALADVLRDAATELAPLGTTRATVEIGGTSAGNSTANSAGDGAGDGAGHRAGNGAGTEPDGAAPPAPRTSSDDLQPRSA